MNMFDMDTLRLIISKFPCRQDYEKAINSKNNDGKTPHEVYQRELGDFKELERLLSDSSCYEECCKLAEEKSKTIQ